MKTVFFLLLRLICYPALAIVVAAGIALIVVWVNGECSPVSEMGMTCATKLSQTLADFGFGVVGVIRYYGYPIVLAVGGLIFLMRDARRKPKPAPSSQAPS
jgi:hypothetical protein